MLVCHIQRRFFPLYVGGVESYIFRLSNFLSQEKDAYQFLLLTDRTSGLKKFERYGSLGVYRLGFNLPQFFTKMERIYMATQFLEAKYLPTLKNVEVFNSHGMYQSYEAELGFRLSKHFRKPLIFTLHGWFGPGPEKMWLTESCLKILKKHVHTILCNSISVLSRLKKIGLSEKSQFIPNFINSSFFNCPTSIRKNLSGKKVLLIARLTHRKDPITPVLAFKYVCKEIPDAELHIVGYGPLEKQLEQLIRKLRLEKRVFLHGKQYNVRKFLWSSDIFLATDVITNHCSLSLLEAMAAGLATIAYDVGETRDVLRSGENGILVPHGKPKVLARVLLNLLADRNFQHKLSANAVETAKQFDIRTIAPRIASIYENSLTKKH